MSWLIDELEVYSFNDYLRLPTHSTNVSQLVYRDSFKPCVFFTFRSILHRVTTTLFHHFIFCAAVISIYFAFVCICYETYLSF